MSGALLAQGYTLQPGDVLQADIIRLGNARWTSMVNSDGYIRFPYIGQHFATGKTLDELQEDIVLSVVGQRISVLDGGVETVVVLNENSVFLDIAEYRPVTVVGAVSMPGSVPYRPGLTVRAVLGIAGGISVARGEEPGQESRIATLHTRIAELQKTEAWMALDLWRINGQLDPAFSENPPAEFTEILESRFDPAILDETRMRIAEAEQNKQLEISKLRDRVVLSNDRIAYLTQALEQYEVVSQWEEERLANLLTLQERGLVVAKSVRDARSGALSSSSRLLQSEADLSDTKRELASLAQQIEMVDVDFRQGLLEEKARMQRSLDETRARLQGNRQELTELTGQVVDDVTGDPVAPRILLHRRLGQTTTSTIAQPDDIVFPGDVIEVLLTETAQLQ